MDQFSRSTTGLEYKDADNGWLGPTIAGLSLLFMACFTGYACYTLFKTERYLEGLICLLFAGFMVFLALTALVSQPLPVLIKLLAKWMWCEDALKVRVQVIDSKCDYHPWNCYPEDIYDNDDIYGYELAITLPVEITRDVQPKTYWVSVNESAYKRCSWKKNIWLYYAADNPRKFLIEGE